MNVRLPFSACCGAGGKDQRLDHHGYRAGHRQHAADVDVVELFELETVDRDDCVVDAHFLAQVNADLATLTYAVMAAVGGAYSGIFCNDERLNRQLTAAGEATGERLWRLPIDGYYDTNLESGIADFRHHSPDDESADAAHAAALLKNFVEDRPWAHLDIANKEFSGKDRAMVPAGATGYAVALLEEFAAGLE